MGNLLKDGSDWLQDQLSDHAATEVTYIRNSESLTLDATVGRTEFENESDTGIVERIETRDYLIDVASLVLSGKTAEPRRGDVIEEVQGGTTHRYEVTGVFGEPEWRYSDPYRRKYRIHTTQVKLIGQ